MGCSIPHLLRRSKWQGGGETEVEICCGWILMPELGVALLRSGTVVILQDAACVLLRCTFWKGSTLNTSWALLQ